jgi:hypothetical protein
MCKTKPAQMFYKYHHCGVDMALMNGIAAGLKGGASQILSSVVIKEEAADVKEESDQYLGAAPLWEEGIQDTPARSPKGAADADPGVSQSGGSPDGVPGMPSIPRYSASPPRRTAKRCTAESFAPHTPNPGSLPATPAGTLPAMPAGTVPATPGGRPLRRTRQARGVTPKEEGSSVDTPRDAEGYEVRTREGLGKGRTGKGGGREGGEGGRGAKGNGKRKREGAAVEKKTVEREKMLATAVGVPERLGDAPLRLIIIGTNPSDTAWCGDPFLSFLKGSCIGLDRYRTRQ